MTEFWVSQGNKWCDFCKIFISNNSTSIRTHELGTRHKDNVAKKLAGIKKDNAVKEKEKLLALKDLEKIESQAKKSYERDLAAMRSLDSTPKMPVTDTKNKGSVTRVHAESLEAVPAAHGGSGCEPADRKAVRNAIPQAIKGQKSATQNVSSALRHGRSGKGMVASSLEVSKRKRVEKPGSNSSEEAAALAARESARKRIKEREEALLGLYHSF
ncbi:unnamed protein product [Calypogeia fissa]